MKPIPFMDVSNSPSPDSSLPGQATRRKPVMGKARYPAESGLLILLDSGFRRNDEMVGGRCALKSQACQAGVTLVEMVTFIVIVSIAMVGLMRAYTSILTRAPTASQLTQATQLAQERMELILAQKDVLVFSSPAFDPCVASPLAAICILPVGFNIAVTGAVAPVPPPAPWPDIDTTRYRLITVIVTDSQGVTLTKLQSVLANANF